MINMSVYKILSFLNFDLWCLFDILRVYSENYVLKYGVNADEVARVL